MNNNRFFSMFGGLLLLLFLGACASNSGSNNGQLTSKDAEWVKGTTFKLDFNEKGAKPENIKVNKSLVAYILDGVESGAIPAYDFDSNKQLNKKAIQQIFHPIDSVVQIDFDTGMETGMKAVQNELNRPAVNKFRVKQEWFYDEQSHKLGSTVKAVAPLETIFNSDGSERGDLPLFWVKM